MDYQLQSIMPSVYCFVRQGITKFLYKFLISRKSILNLSKRYKPLKIEFLLLFSLAEKNCTNANKKCSRYNPLAAEKHTLSDETNKGFIISLYSRSLCPTAGS